MGFRRGQYRNAYNVMGAGASDSQEPILKVGLKFTFGFLDNRLVVDVAENLSIVSSTVIVQEF